MTTQYDRHATQRDKSAASAENSSTNRRPRLSGDDRELIQRLALQGWSAGEIHDKIVRVHAEQRALGVDAPPDPTLRTVQRHMPKLTGDRWTLADAEDETAAVVAEVLGAIAVEPEIRRDYLLSQEAEWIGRIWRVAPDLPPLAMFKLAAHSRVDEVEPLSSPTVSTLLAIAPWRSTEHRESWLEALDDLPGGKHGQLTLAWWLLCSKPIGKALEMKYEAWQDANLNTSLLGETSGAPGLELFALMRIVEVDAMELVMREQERVSFVDTGEAEDE